MHMQKKYILSLANFSFKVSAQAWHSTCSSSTAFPSIAQVVSVLFCFLPPWSDSFFCFSESSSASWPPLHCLGHARSATLPPVILSSPLSSLSVVTRLIRELVVSEGDVLVPGWEAIIAALAASSGPAGFFFDKSFTPSNLNSTYCRSMVPFGSPLPGGFKSTQDRWPSFSLEPSMGSRPSNMLCSLHLNRRSSLLFLLSSGRRRGKILGAPRPLQQVKSLAPAKHVKVERV